MAGSFFSNCSDFTINGGKFVSVNGGDMNVYHTYSYSATTESHNQNNFAGKRAPRPEQPYGYRQEGPPPPRSCSTQEDPYRYHDPRRQATLPALLDTRMHEEELTSAQFDNRYRQPQPEYARPPSARSAPPPMSPPWTRGAQGPIPRASDSTLGDAGLPSDSVTFTEAPHPLYSPHGQLPTGNGQHASVPPSSWAPRPGHSGPPPAQSVLRSPTRTFSQNQRPPRRQSDRRNSSGDETESSDSESETSRPPHPPRSHQSSENDAASEWRA